MLDVLHYLLEEDANFVSQEQYQSRDHVRNVVYKNVYNKSYVYANSDTRDFGYESAADDLDIPVTTAAKSTEVKPYIPPTRVNADADNPFQGVLREGPIG